MSNEEQKNNGNYIHVIKNNIIIIILINRY